MKLYLIYLKIVYSSCYFLQKLKIIWAQKVKYHNWRHALNVCQTMFTMLKTGKMDRWNVHNYVHNVSQFVQEHWKEDVHNAQISKDVCNLFTFLVHYVHNVKNNNIENFSLRFCFLGLWMSLKFLGVLKWLVFTMAFFIFVLGLWMNLKFLDFSWLASAMT